MIKRAVYIIWMALPLSLPAQRGDELLVYSVKGSVTVLYKNVEEAVKIGRVLKPGDIIKTKQGASLTMLCNKGKAICVSKEGSFPVSNWKDSCRIAARTVSSNYFKYIWGQMYAYSPEHKEEMRRKNDMAVSRGDPPPNTGSKKKARLSFSKGMDTVNYFNKLDNFPLSWDATNYNGQFIFRLYDAKNARLLYKDSLRARFIPVSRFRHVMEPGKSYYWTVNAKSIAGSRKRFLHYHASDEMVNSHIRINSLPEGITEDSASASFRTAYLLEKKHCLEFALLWYETANAADPENVLFRDQLIRFRNEFWIR
jgi:hypothetical protein